ncbi:MAG: hypothetical protein AAGA56_15710 [Myxococcota bacterium]
MMRAMAPFLALMAACGGRAAFDGDGGDATTTTTSTNAGTNTVTTDDDDDPLGCEALEEAYVQSLNAARACDPNVRAIQCDTIVSDTLFCPCPTTVNSGRGAALQRLSDFRTQFDQLNCGAQVDCPAIACIEPVLPSVCGANGLCLDTLAN